MRSIEHWLSYATHISEGGASFHTVQSELATPYMSLKHSTIILAILRSMEKGYWMRARELPGRRAVSSNMLRLYGRNLFLDF
jgi:hypothetical protein